MRRLLLPFSILFGLVTAFRNLLFDLGLLPVYRPKLFTIAVGNLSVGGTGKTPFTEYLASHLSGEGSLAIVSRGYGRKSRGFVEVQIDSSPLETGDEALQVKRKFPGVYVAVCESRRLAIEKIEREQSGIRLVVLDDAFQHRYVKANLSILLTTFREPFWRDFVLPAGRLREWRSASDRADAICITKCPVGITGEELMDLSAHATGKRKLPVFASVEKYAEVYPAFGIPISERNFKSALAVSGIANDESLIRHIKSKYGKVENYRLKDHIVYSDAIVSEIISRFRKLDGIGPSCIITTEKDVVKLTEFSERFRGIPLLVQGIKMELRDEAGFISFLRGKISA